MRALCAASRSGRFGLIALAVVVFASADTFQSAAGAGRPGAAVVSRDEVVHGRLTDHGVPVSGADVVLVADPAPEVIAKAARDTRTPVRVAGVTRTDRDGSFHLDVDPATIGAKFRSSDGTVNFELYLADSSRQIGWMFSAHRDHAADAGHTWLAHSADLRGRAIPEVNADFHAGWGLDRVDAPLAAFAAGGSPAGVSAQSVPVRPRGMVDVFLDEVPVGTSKSTS